MNSCTCIVPMSFSLLMFPQMAVAIAPNPPSIALATRLVGESYTDGWLMLSCCSQLREISRVGPEAIDGSVTTILIEKAVPPPV